MHSAGRISVDLSTPSTLWRYPQPSPAGPYRYDRSAGDKKWVKFLENRKLRNFTD